VVLEGKLTYPTVTCWCGCDIEICQGCPHIHSDYCLEIGNRDYSFHSHYCVYREPMRIAWEEEKKGGANIYGG